LEQPDATQAKFTGGWGRTGDLATCDDEGFYWYKGRTERCHQKCSYRIDPEIEDLFV
jgi:acetyl-CoA synthetase